MNETISNMVQALKDGKISKSELFTQLSNLKPLEDKAEETRTTSQPHLYKMDSPTKRDRLSRRSLIEKLIMDRNSVQSDEDSGDESSNMSDIVALQDFEMNEKIANMSINTLDTMYVENGEFRYEDNDRQLDIKPFSKSVSSPKRFSPDRQSLRRDMTLEELQHQRAREYTFTPKINALPHDYDTPAGSSATFHARVARWKEKRETHKHQRRQELLEHEIEQCTFKPAINEYSQQVMEKRRGRAAQSATERLSQSNNYLKRERMAKLQQQAKDEQFKSECTFKPKINSKSAKYAKKTIPKEPARAKAQPTTDMQECTFKPKTNPVHRNMSSAQQYVKTNIFERLSAQNADEEPQWQDKKEITFDHDPSVAYDVNIKKKNSNRPASAPNKNALMSQANPKFESFFARQQEQAKKKEDKLTRCKQETEPSHQPHINAKSSQLLEQKGNSGDFLERLRKNELRRRSANANENNTSYHDSQCTFSPKINAKSAKRVARTVTDLSRGDMLKRETSTNLLRLQVEQDQMRDVTFQPSLSKASQNVRGKLRILSEPETYIQRIKREDERYKEKLELAAQLKESDEVSRCTFKPQVHQAPTYITKIARSMALAKASRDAEQQNQEVKPCWK